MAKEDARPGFLQSRFKLGSRDEVRVGAYARRQRRKMILIGALGVGLIAAAFGLYTQLRPRADADNPEQYPVTLRCDACGHTFETAAKFRQTFPVKCEKCGETACRPLWRCRDCNALFVPDRTGTTVVCPECGSLAVGSAATP